MPRAAARDLIYRRRHYSAELIEQRGRRYIRCRLSYLMTHGAFGQGERVRPKPPDQSIRLYSRAVRHECPQLRRLTCSCPTSRHHSIARILNGTGGTGERTAPGICARTCRASRRGSRRPYATDFANATRPDRCESRAREVHRFAHRACRLQFARVGKAC